MPLSKKYHVFMKRVMTGRQTVLHILCAELRVGVGKVRRERKSLPDRGDSRYDGAEAGKMGAFQELKKTHVAGR